MAEIQYVDVESSNIAAIGYNEDTKELYVRFSSGAVYIYQDVQEEVYQEFLDASSKGKYLNEHIKGVYQYAKA